MRLPIIITIIIIIIISSSASYRSSSVSYENSGTGNYVAVLVFEQRRKMN